MWLWVKRYKFAAVAIPFIFTAGISYGSIKSDIADNKVAVQSAVVQVQQVKVELQQQRLDDFATLREEINKLDSKIDDLNKFLRVRIK